MAAEIGLGCAMRCVARVRILILAPLRSTEWMELISASRRGSGPGPAEHQQIIRDDTEPHPTLHPALAAVSAAPQTMTALERTDPSFTARSPAEGQAGNSRAGCARLARKHDMPDSALVRDAFIHRRGKATVSDGELRRAAKELDMSVQGGSPQAAVSLPALTHRVIGDELRLGLLDLHEPSELRRLGQLALADDVGVWLEQADDFAAIVRIAAKHASPRLRQHLPDQFDCRGQLGGVAAAARSRQRALGLAHDRAGDSQETLVELLHLGLGPRADRRGRPRAGRATALGELEDPARHAARALADLLPDPAQAAREHPNLSFAKTSSDSLGSILRSTGQDAEPGWR